MKYGIAPDNLGLVDCTCSEMMHYQCLPIKLLGDTFYTIPKRLEWIRPLLDAIQFHKDKYVYVTARNTFVSNGASGSRPGWHSDGFLTGDVNYIWSSCLPTEFAIQSFSIDDSCEQSLKQFEDQIIDDNITSYADKTLVKLTSGVIHRPRDSSGFNGLRQFVKVSVSDDKYNLIGNSRNYDLAYDWEMVDRNEDRNHQNA